MNGATHNSYWQFVWKRFTRHSLGYFSLWVVLLFCAVGIYAPFLASSKPLMVKWQGDWYFPLFAYLFYPGFYTKRLDIFFNLLMFTVPAALIAWKLQHVKLRYFILAAIACIQVVMFVRYSFFEIKDPASDPALNQARQEAGRLDWAGELSFMTPYAQLNAILQYQQQRMQQERLSRFEQEFRNSAKTKWMRSAVRNKRAELLREGIPYADLPNDEQLEQLVLKDTPAEIITVATAMPTLWHQKRNNEHKELARLQQVMKSNPSDSDIYRQAQTKVRYIMDKQTWLEEQSKELSWEVMPLLRPFHWEDDAGGDQNLNRYISLWELTRINRKDMMAALIFGVRISLVVGITSVLLALIIGIPVGAMAGYYGGKTDIIVSRLLEIWEAMPVFFMLLLVVAITQSKSIFLIVAVIGIFGWTNFSRYLRGEFFKQRHLSYVEACRGLGYSDANIIFSQVLPNAIPPLLTLLPFAVMGAITSEAGLSFLGLGEEGSCSWGVLMDEGRTAFPGESYLLWPPAILLTILLVAIALVGDALRDALDPKS